MLHNSPCIVCVHRKWLIVFTWFRQELLPSRDTCESPEQTAGVAVEQCSALRALCLCFSSQELHAPPEKIIPKKKKVFQTSTTLTLTYNVLRKKTPQKIPLCFSITTESGHKRYNTGRNTVVGSKISLWHMNCNIKEKKVRGHWIIFHLQRLWLSQLGSVFLFVCFARRLNRGLVFSPNKTWKYCQTEKVATHRFTCASYILERQWQW